MLPALQPRTTPGARVEALAPGFWRLALPAGPSGVYRLAQLDDYLNLPRRRFPWQPPLRLSLQARVSAPALPGTWGFGFWNDPFSASLGLGGAARRLPALPNTAWFFHASPPNHLTLHADRPASGFLAAGFASPAPNAFQLAACLPLLPLAFLPPAARLLRRLAARLVQEDASLLDVDVTAWHTYSLEWLPTGLVFHLDGSRVWQSPLCPAGRLALVIWIDNQFAAFPPDGRLRMGTLANPQPAWLEVRALALSQPG